MQRNATGKRIKEKLDEILSQADRLSARVGKILKNVPGIGNMEYLAMRTMEYFIEQD